MVESPLTLLELQQEFTLAISEFITWASTQKILVTFGEAYRPPEMARIYAERHQGITNSNHTRRLAIDLNFFKGELLIEKQADMEIIGNKWEEMSLPGFKCSWGGRFKSPDCDHFSFEYQGIQ